MFNALGKTLVFINLTVSLLAMSWAAAIFLQFVDWGWKEPRKYLDERIASEYDKRAAALADAHRAYDLVRPGIAPAQTNVRNAETRFPVNHLFYVAELDRLGNNSADAIEIKEIKMADGSAVLDVPVVGRPVLADAAPVNKSFVKYQADLKAVQAQIDEVSGKIKAVLATEKALGLRLTGADDKPGVYRLVEIEKETHEQIKSEKAYVRPLWVSALREVEVYQDRRARLETTLEKLKKSQGK